MGAAFDGMLDRMATTQVLWRDDITGVCFKACPHEVFKAEAEVNRLIHVEGVCTLEAYLALLGICNRVPKRQRSTSGWCYECLLEGAGEYAGDTWIYFNHRVENPNGMTVFVISPSLYPCDGYASCAGLEEWKGEPK